MDKTKLIKLLREALAELEQEDSQLDFPFMPGGVTINQPVCEKCGSRHSKDSFCFYGVYKGECLVEAFFKANPNASAAMISCPCPKCSVHC